jgi:NADPH:quinone reductase-like Zn-dependent oxidoreductase
MRAAVLTAYGEPPEVREFDDPPASPDAGHAVVEVLAAGLNPVDLSMASGTFYGGSPPLPSVVGREGIGRTGDGRIVYFDRSVSPLGSFAERTLIELDPAYDVPEGLDPALAVAWGIAGLAAWLALEWRAELKEGETVLVLGAGGSVGQIAVQAAKLLGAGRVVAASRSAERLDRARELGADATVNPSETDDVTAAIQEAAGGGVDVTVDPVWGEPARHAIDASNPGARHVQLGQSAGAESTLASAPIRGRMLAILGHTNFAVPVEVKRAAYTRMAEHALAGELTVDLERVPLDEAPEAWERQRGGPHRKLVIVP